MLITSISGTNTTSHTFMPFTDGSFINACLLQPILHLSHPLLLQFFGITNSFLSTVVLFSRFCRHRIQTWAIKAASYPAARWILRSHMRYAQGCSGTETPFRFFFWQPEPRSGSFLYKNPSQQCIRTCYLNSGVPHS